MLIAIAVSHTLIGSTERPKTMRIPGTAYTITVSAAQMISAIHTNLFFVISFLKKAEPLEDMLKT